jgi:hypothetical protein
VGAAGEDVVEVNFISMPWCSLEHPSIQLGILKGILQRHAVPCELMSLNLAFFERVARVLKRGSFFRVGQDLGLERGVVQRQLEQTAWTQALAATLAR